MLQPVKIGFGAYMSRFYQHIAPTTKWLDEYVKRGLEKSIVWAPGRMVDMAEDMLASWRRNDTDQAATQPPKLPIILVAMSKDYTPTNREFTRQVAESVFFTLPNDSKERVFGIKSIAGDIRTQIAICAHDEPTARSLAAQVLLYVDSVAGRRFMASYSFAGQSFDWPVQIETPESPAMSIPTEEKNLTIMTVDFVLKATIPLFDAPKVGEENDGKGIAGDVADPAGYPVVVVVDPVRIEPRP